MGEYNPCKRIPRKEGESEQRLIALSRTNQEVLFVLLKSLMPRSYVYR